MRIKTERIPRPIVTALALLLLALAIVGCATANGDPGSIDEDAMELSAEAQEAITMAQQALVEEMGVDVSQIELESIAEPATEDDPYVIRLRVGDEIHEYHVRAGEALRVSDPLPTAPAE